MFKIIVFFLCWMLALPGLAESVAYTIPISSQTEVDRKEAERQVFEKILRILTMNDEKKPFSSLSPDQFLESYRYEKTSTTLNLMLRFDQTELVKALQAQGVPVVRDNRPSLLALIAVQEPRDAWVVGEPSESIYHQGLQTQAQERGLTLFFPLMDLDDIQNLDFSAVWNDSPEQRWSSAQRYHPQGLLVGKIDLVGDGTIHSSWTLDLRSQRYDWDIPAQDPSEMLVMLMDNISAVYRDVFALHTQQERQTLRLNVEGIHDLATLNAAIAALKRVEGVSDVATYSISSHAATFDLSMLGNRQALIDALAMNAHFRPIDDQQYEWRSS